MARQATHQVTFRHNDDFPVAPLRQDCAEFEVPFVRVRRANGDRECNSCERPYRKHPHDLALLDMDGHPWARVLCDGERVKL